MLSSSKKGRRILLPILLFAAAFHTDAYAQKVIRRSDRIEPRWVKAPSSVRQLNPTYEFKLVDDAGPSLENLSNNRLTNLARFLQTKNNLEGVIDKKVESENSRDGFDSRISHKISFRTNTTTEEFRCMMIDNYWEQIRIPGNGIQYQYYTLYAVSVPGQYPLFDHFSKTTAYGARGLWRSAIIPGWGQFHKGANLKGGLMLGGCALLAGGIVFTENQRADYDRKIKRTHDIGLIRSYTTKKDHFATARNICIGAAAALYLYNLIDAVAAPGARRIVVKRTGRPERSYAVAPALLPDGAAGLTAAMTF